MGIPGDGTIADPVGPGSVWTVFVSYSSLFGGSERILIDRVSRLGDGVILCCPPGPLARRAREAGLSVRELTSTSLVARRGLRTRVHALIDVLRIAGEVRAVVAELAPAVVVLWGTRTVPLALKDSDGVPRVFVHNDLLPRGRLVRGIIRRAARRCAAVTVLSQAAGAELAGVRCDVIPGGVDLAAIVATPVPTQPAVAVVGAIVGWKRPDLALEILARAAREIPGLTLTIVGAPLAGDPDGAALLETLRVRCRRSDLQGRVSFTGHVDDGAAAIRDAGCLLHCSDAEPFGLVLVEALAAGRPVVAPRAGGVTDIVDATCGRLYEPGDVAGGAAALLEVLGDSDRTQALGTAARHRAERRFGLEGTAAQFAAVLGRVRADR